MATRSFIESFVMQSIKEGNTFQFNKVDIQLIRRVKNGREMDENCRR